MKGARVLLTGGTGFIGSRVAAALAAKGAELSLLVRDSSSGARLGPLWDKARRVKGDLDSPASLAAAVAAADPEYCVHLAKTPGASFEREAKATAALAAALAKMTKLKRWVRTAHAAGAGGPSADRELARVLALKHGLEVATLELYLVYGPGHRDGEYPRDVVEEALAGRPLRAPSDEKDLVYVDDVAEAYALALEAPRAAGSWVSIGGGRLAPGHEVATAAAKATGRSWTDVLPAKERRPGGEPAPLGPAARFLNWAPSTSLDEGIRALAAWCKTQKGAA